MQNFASHLPQFELYEVTIGWLVFALIFLTRKRAPRTAEQVRDRRAVVGLLIQIAGYAIVRLGLRPPGTGFLAAGPSAEIAAALIACALMVASLYLSYAAVRTLGKQWSLAARLVQGHELVQAGPYALVRHPIYTGMFGMLVATAIAVSSWPALLIASAVFAFGTALRIHVEEQLLVTAFGDVYLSYARGVPALIPWWPAAGPRATGNGRRRP